MAAEITLETRTGTFRALTDGDDGAPVVLLLHGFPDTARTWETMLPAVAASGLRAVAPWIRGYAPSTLEGPYGIDALAEDAIAMADSLSPDRPIAIVGHDWGALASYVACSKAPQRFSAAVTMAVPYPLAIGSNLRALPRQMRRSWYIAFFQLPRVERAVEKDDFAFIDRLWRDWSPGFTPPPELIADLKRCLAASMPAPLAHYRALRKQRWERHAPRIVVPTLHLQGRNDGCIGAEMARGQERFFRGPFRSDIVEAAGHFLHLERPDEVTRAVLAWIEDNRQDAKAPSERE